VGKTRSPLILSSQAGASRWAKAHRPIQRVSRDATVAPG